MGKFGAPKSHKYCCVSQCKSRCTNEVSLFYVPKDEALRKRWADAIKLEKGVTQHMQVCSRHFTKNDYILSEYPGTTKVRRLKKSAVPTQNLPWQFPNKRVSPTLVKARMERLKNRTQLKTSNTPKTKTDAKKHKESEDIQSSSQDDDDESSDEKSMKNDDDPFDQLLEEEKETTDNNETEIAGNESVQQKDEAEKKEVIMRDRAPTRLRQRQGVLKCELCGRKCLTPQALRTHQQIAHKNVRNDHMDPEKSPPAMIKPKEPVKPIPVALISVKQRETLMEPKAVSKVNNNEKHSKISSLVEQVLRDDDSTTDSETDGSSEGNAMKLQLKPEKKAQTKIEFECPKCKKRFAVLFSAIKHIQKHHPAQKGDKFETQDLKPTRIEICTICNTTLTSNIHTCLGPVKLANGFVCTGCNQVFKSLMLFDLHNSGMHCNGVESMFFPSLDEFENWKQKMENQTKVSYTVLDQNDTKKVHRCTHVVTTGTGTRSRAHMCPSSIIVQEFTKGFQVHYYPNHHGHESSSYNLSKTFSKYSIASLMNITASQLPDDSDDEDLKETDLYIQFRRLTELLVNDAARINVNGLKKLMRKALEMITIMNNYNEDEDSMTFSDADDDLKDQVKNALRGFKKSLKRPSGNVVDTSLIKRSKPVFQSTENTLKEKSKVKSNSAVIKMKEEIENVSEKRVSDQKPLQSPSFIDTFQQFVGKTRENTIVPKPRKPRSEAYPIGQRNGKKEIVKTKIGQFKPSPNKRLTLTSNPVSPSRNSIGSVKDIEYEVKEQENDCNILILKI